MRRGEIYKDGTIPYQRFRAWELAGRTAGLVGLGAVGRALRWRLRGLGLEVLAYDPYADEPTVSLDELLARADVVSMHAPVTPETTGMIGAKEFDSMRDGVVFLNTARAQLHDTDALVAALRSGKVAAAGLDHFEGESLAVDHPLTQLDSVVLAPHIGGATYDTESNHTAIIAEDLCRLLAGARPLHIVNPEVLDAPVSAGQPGDRPWSRHPAPAPPRPGQSFLLDQRVGRSTPFPSLPGVPDIRPSAVPGLSRLPVERTSRPRWSAAGPRWSPTPATCRNGSPVVTRT